MKRIILWVAMLVVTAGAVLAHGKEQHVVGKVTAMTDSSITVQTKSKGRVTVYTMPKQSTKRAVQPLR